MRAHLADFVATDSFSDAERKEMIRTFPIPGSGAVVSISTIPASILLNW